VDHSDGNSSHKEVPLRAGSKRKSCGDAQPAANKAKKRVLRRATGAVVKVNGAALALIALEMGGRWG